MRRNTLFVGLLLLYLAVLLRITVFRSGFGRLPLCSGTVLLVPFTDIFLLARTQPLRFLYLFVGNLIWFVPLGFLLMPSVHRGPRVLLLGFGLSLAIEAAQFVFGTGYSETEDLILNTLGTALGIGLWHLFLRLRRLRQSV